MQLKAKINLRHVTPAENEEVMLEQIGFTKLPDATARDGMVSLLVDLQPAVTEHRALPTLRMD